MQVFDFDGFVLSGFVWTPLARCLLICHFSGCLVCGLLAWMFSYLLIVCGFIV